MLGFYAEIQFIMVTVNCVAFKILQFKYVEIQLFLMYIYFEADFWNFTFKIVKTSKSQYYTNLNM